MALHLFQGFGIELEYMIVSADSLNVDPIADKLMHAAAGKPVSDVERGNIAWSNELALHVVELKTNGPASSLANLDKDFQENIRFINGLLGPMNARLMPSAMHPWMNPDVETKLWPHEYTEVYQAFDRIFSCRGHGWSNLQSMHINLPFGDDVEFGRLHAAIRMLLPILPALAASSPYVEGAATGLLDSRLEMYRLNCQRVPSVTGHVIPEPVFSQETYAAQVLAPMYQEIAPLDEAGVLQDEFLNARGAIARFSRDAIEIRVLDLQECPRADIAIASLIVAVLEKLVNGRWLSYKAQQTWTVDQLEPLFRGTLRDAEESTIRDRAYLEAFGLRQDRASAGELWHHLFSEVGGEIPPTDRATIRSLLDSGPLARRLLRATGPIPNKTRLHSVYEELSECLANGTLFRA